MKNLFIICACLLMTSSISFAQNDPTGDDWVTPPLGATHTFNNVGIGTATPAFNLQLRGSGIQTFEVESTDDQVTWSLDNTGSNGKTIRYRTNGSTKGGIQMPANTEELRFQTGGPVNRMTIKADGKVGIGTITPNTDFTVSGDADVSGHLGVGVSDTSLSRMMTLIGNRGVGALIADTSQGGTALRAEQIPIGNPADGIGIIGLANAFDFFGIGAQFFGGWWGSRSAVFPTGGANRSYFGSLGIVNGGTGVADSSVNFGVYGFADGADPNQSGAGPIGDWAVFAAGESYSTVGWTASDKRYKTNIQDIDDNALEVIMDLQPKSYEFVQGDFIKTSGGTLYGFIAQELEEVIPEAVRNTRVPIIDHKKDELNPDKAKMADLKVVNHNSILPFVVKAVQEQQEQIEELKADLATKDAEIEEMKDLVRQVEQDMQQCCLQHQTGSTQGNGSSSGTGIDDKAQLAQNIPNPFNERTVIKYYIPSSSEKGNVESGMIRVMDINGNVLWRFDLVDTGYGQVEIDANTFAPATYIYELIVGDKKIDSKKMTISN